MPDQHAARRRENDLRRKAPLVRHSLAQRRLPQPRWRRTDMSSKAPSCKPSAKGVEDSCGSAARGGHPGRSSAPVQLVDVAILSPHRIHRALRAMDSHVRKRHARNAYGVSAQRTPARATATGDGSDAKIRGCDGTTCKSTLRTTAYSSVRFTTRSPPAARREDAAHHKHARNTAHGALALGQGTAKPHAPHPLAVQHANRPVLPPLERMSAMTSTARGSRTQQHPAYQRYSSFALRCGFLGGSRATMRTGAAERTPSPASVSSVQVALPITLATAPFTYTPDRPRCSPSCRPGASLPGAPSPTPRRQGARAEGVALEDARRARRAQANQQALQAVPRLFPRRWRVGWAGGATS
ncbi:hypothetical protein CGC21_26165 [Leishmania donovani]|uniref:Uncharacterized protein n=1 Tax=Leishmania donovani TaxID=5661 RepID=A0A504WZD4_LEIDO|nr:hypothetical protein CGC21_26165 [Leishmania donovani]